jgi:hypothetical protein
MSISDRDPGGIYCACPDGCCREDVISCFPASPAQLALAAIGADRRREVSPWRMVKAPVWPPQGVALFVFFQAQYRAIFTAS